MCLCSSTRRNTRSTQMWLTFFWEDYMWVHYPSPFPYLDAIRTIFFPKESDCKCRESYSFSHIIFLILVIPSEKAKFDIDTNDAVVRMGCIEMMKSAVRQWRHKLKQVHFDPFPLHLVRKTSPVKSTSDAQWNELVESWKTPHKMVFYPYKPLPSTWYFDTCLTYILYMM